MTNFLIRKYTGGDPHLAAMEVDTETGKVTLRKYVCVDDCGVQINPLIVEGQVHGGLAQGIAQAMYEGAVYDKEGNRFGAGLFNPRARVPLRVVVHGEQPVGEDYFTTTLERAVDWNSTSHRRCVPAGPAMNGIVLKGILGLLKI